MPLVSGIVRVESTNVDCTRPAACGVVGDAKMHGFEPLAGLCDSFDIGHTARGFNQNVDADAMRNAARFFYLSEKGVYQIDIRGYTHFGDEHGVQAVSCLLHHVNDITIHVVRVDAIDSDTDCLTPLAPVMLQKAADDIAACLLLVTRCDGILEVEEDVVRLSILCFREHGRLRAGYCELAAL